ncbi:ATP-binding cassette domain-containing protein [Actinotalea sp. K2]|uniref:ATP-binding cassette domain-containing protein n=1 Tax=Actinotalea sp. K2 TaxID=2939438 RepID=UPI0020170352|nr:ATP-binding cassette domain-containing protein [Actinotalea sp. K2]MCL3861816.1 ATP-binding cassette domain-containing protein [Actinotalea sp. K2]
MTVLSGCGTGGRAVVEVDASLHVGEFTVIVDLALTDAHGPVTALVGPSGSGKSLTLALIAGLLRPRRGQVLLHGRPVCDVTTGLHVPTQDRHVGMVFQDALLLPHRSVLDNVALAVRTGRTAERRDRARHELDRVGAGGLASAAPRTLSGGERQRVALARALAGDPGLLLLDEPLSALDRQTRLRLRALLRDVVTTGSIPTLLVSHDPDEVRELADTTVPVEPGRVGGDVPRGGS